MAHYKFHNDCQSSVLTYEQVKRLDSVMDQTVPIHGRGNFPTLFVKLKELIRLVKYKLQKEHSIEIRDVRLNGGAASYVLAPENSHYNDLDLIFGTDLSDEDRFDVIRDVVLECLKEFFPNGQQQPQQQPQQQQQQYQHQQQQHHHHQSYQMPLSNCAIKEAYVHKMVKVNDDDRWSLISLGVQHQQPGTNCCGQQTNCANSTLQRACGQQQQPAHQQFALTISAKENEPQGLINNNSSAPNVQNENSTAQAIVTSCTEQTHQPPAAANQQNQQQSQQQLQYQQRNHHHQQQQQKQFPNNIELKFVDRMRRKFEFSVDSFQIILDSLIQFYDYAPQSTINSDLANSAYDDRTSCAVISENFYPTVISRSEYGNFKEALYHLERKLIATRSPEEIRGGGLLKYCNLLVKNYKPTNVYQIRTLERYMCSRFFIDFSDLNQQQAKLESYLANHFSDDPILKFDYLTILHNVVLRSTVCLMNHELRLTLNMIRDLAWYVHKTVQVNDDDRWGPKSLGARQSEANCCGQTNCRTSTLQRVGGQQQQSHQQQQQFPVTNTKEYEPRGLNNNNNNSNIPKVQNKDSTAAAPTIDTDRTEQKQAQQHHQSAPAPTPTVPAHSDRDQSNHDHQQQQQKQLPNSIELKIVDRMRRKFEFSVDSFQILLDSLMQFYDHAPQSTMDQDLANSAYDDRTSCAVISENFYPTVISRSEYGNFKEALYLLEKKLIATRSPEEIRAGGLLKYCNLLVKKLQANEFIANQNT